jgi:uncharacterized protein (DUF1697 family)
MTRHVALLRGVNVGKAKRVAMADLRALVEGLGCTDVKTLLKSGNVVFSTRDISPVKFAARIETTMSAELGVTARVTVLTGVELAAVLADNPLPQATESPSRLLVAVPRASADLAKLKPLLKRDQGSDVIALGPRAAYLWCREGILASDLWPAVDRALGAAVTCRNWATMTKLAALVSPTK